MIVAGKNVAFFLADVAVLVINVSHCKKPFPVFGSMSCYVQNPQTI